MSVSMEKNTHPARHRRVQERKKETEREGERKKKHVGIKTRIQEFLGCGDRRRTSQYWVMNNALSHERARILFVAQKYANVK